MKLLKVIFNRPIYKKDVLKYASKHYFIQCGMCAAIKHALSIYKIHTVGSGIFSEYFNLEIAINKFRATRPALGHNYYDYYWWSNDKLGWYYRKLYFKWLIEQYKDDKEDLRKYR